MTDLNAMRRHLRRPASGFGRRRRLLAGTILAGMIPAIAAAQQTDGTAEPSSNAVVLKPITVQGREPDASTEGTGSYTSDAVTIGKDATPVREIPQSVSVLTRQRLDDQNLTTLDEALRQSTGIVVLNNDEGRSSIFSRGFELDTLLIDGLPAPVSSVYGTQPDLAIFDRVEVLRGPAGLFSGAGVAGGAVNLARKRALDETAASGSVAVGSWSDRRAEVDLTGPLVESGSIRGRVVAAAQDQDSFVHVNDNQATIGYGTVEFDLTETTTLSVAGFRQDRDITPFNGLPAYADGALLDVPRSTFIGADWNRFDNQSTEGIVELEHEFDGGGEARVAARYADRDVDFKYAYSGSAVNPATGTTSLVALRRKYWEESLAIDAHASRPFALFGQTHEVLVGADWRRYEQTTYQGTANGFAPPIDVYDPVWNVPEPDIAFTSRTETVPVQYGVYGQARIRPVAPVTLVLGSRLSWYEAETTNLATGATSEVEVDGEVTPYAGLVVDLTDTLSAYASYSEIFQPQTEADADGDTLDPRVGRQYEAGLKAEFGRLNASAGLFRLRDENRALADVTAPGSFVAAGEVQVQGFEAEVSGSVLPGWDISAGYTYTDTEYLTATPAQEGQAFSTFTPAHNINLWTRYTFQQGPLEDFYLGGGGRYFSSFYSLAQGARFGEDGYVIVDLQAGYRINDNLDASLTVTNVLDEEYYARVGAASVFNFYGEPRAALLKLTASF